MARAVKKINPMALSSVKLFFASLQSLDIGTPLIVNNVLVLSAFSSVTI
jgi:hypothetical protein